MISFVVMVLPIKMIFLLYRFIPFILIIFYIIIDYSIQNTNKRTMILFWHGESVGRLK